MSYVAPEEDHVVFEFRQRNLPGFATVNSALKSFTQKAAFEWHVSVLIVCGELTKHYLPSDREQELLYEFEDRLDELLKASGNALFLARVTHDKRREIIWRVHDPELANSVLKEIIRAKDYPREFDYRIEHDPIWEKPRWYLEST